MTTKEKEEELISMGHNPRSILTAFGDEKVIEKYKEVNPQNADYVYIPPSEEDIADFIEKVYRIVKRV